MDLPPIVRQWLCLDDPECLAWVTRVMEHLAHRLEPEKAVWWWYRPHIFLRNRAPAYFLPENWKPSCVEACYLEAYAQRG